MNEALNDRLWQENRVWFQETFGVPLDPFWEGETGFSVSHFVDFLEPDPTETPREALVRRYGLDVANRIANLI